MPVKTLKEVMSTVSLRMCPAGELRHSREEGSMNKDRESRKSMVHLGNHVRGPGAEGEGRANVTLEEVQGFQVIGSWEVILESLP